MTKHQTFASPEILHPNRRFSSLMLRSCATFVAVLSAVSSHAQTTAIWTSTSGNALWSDTTRWSGGTIPVSGASNTVQFFSSGTGAANTVAATFTATNNLGNNFDLQVLDLRGTAASAFTGTITGNSLAFTGTANTIFNSTGGSLLYTVATNISFINGLTLDGVGSSQTGVTISGTISGSGGLVKNGTGRFNLSGTNTYTGNTTLNAGRLILGSNGGVASSGTLILNGGVLTYSGLGNGSTRTVSNNVLFGGDVQIIDSVNIQGGSTMLFTGPVDLGGATRVITTDNITTSGTISTAQPVIMSGVVSNGGITKSGKGVLLLSNAANSYTGTTTVRMGTVTIGADAPNGANGALGNSTSAVQLGDATTGTANTIVLQTNGSFTVDRAISVNNFNSTGTTVIGSSMASGTSTYSNTITLGKSVFLQSGTTSAATVVFSGQIDDGAGSSSVTVNGPGVVNLSHSSGNTYHGGTVITAGTLLINNATGSGAGSGAISVTAGTLGGAGSVSGAVTIGDGAGSGDSIISPGNSTIGTFTTTSSLSLASDATFKFELNSSSSSADQLVANGCSLNASSQFSFTDLGAGTIATNTQFIIIDNTSGSAISGAFSNLADGSIFTVGANQYQVSYSGGTGNDLVLTVVPEPSTMALVGLGLALALGRSRRLRKGLQ